MTRDLAFAVHGIEAELRGVREALLFRVNVVAGSILR
jgi:hypothetical protein